MPQEFQHFPEDRYPRSYSKNFGDKVRAIGSARRDDPLRASPVERVLGDNMNSGERAIKEYVDEKRATEKWNYREAQRSKARRKKAGRTGRKRGAKRGRE